MKKPRLFVQERAYRLEIAPEQIEAVFPAKHVALKRTEENISVDDIFVSVFRAPMEVLTDGYYEVDPNTLSADLDEGRYHYINDPGDDERAKQVYRRYGKVSEPAMSSDSIRKSTDFKANEKGALVMSIRLCGQFGADVNRTMLLASVMLNETLRSWSVSNPETVCIRWNTPKKSDLAAEHTNW